MINKLAIAFLYAGSLTITAGVKEQNKVAQIITKSNFAREKACGTGSLIKETIRSKKGAYCKDPAVALFVQTYCQGIDNFSESQCSEKIKKLDLSQRYYVKDEITDILKVGKEQIKFTKNFKTIAIKALNLINATWATTLKNNLEKAEELK